VPALITELIEGADNFEIIRDQIAAILALEEANQQTLAQAAGEDPDEWAFRVFLERSNPWAVLQDEASRDDGPSFIEPIVNVSYETSAPDESTSNIVARQKLASVYNIDCYAYGISSGDDDGGHVPGDQQAGTEAQRVARLVRRILMSAHYLRLQMADGIVWKRWVRSITSFDPAQDNRAVDNVVACRVVFEVEHNDFSPQYPTTELEKIVATVKRDSTGEVLVSAEFDYTDS